MKFASHRRGRMAARGRDARREARQVLRRGRAGALILGLAAAAAITVPASASASTGASRADFSTVVGHVYVNDNTKGTNTIGAFDRHADGSLTPAAGAPFAAGGTGTGTGLADQGAIQITPDGRFLIAVDAGSNQVSVLRIHFDGSLSLVRHGVVSSGGGLPDSVAIHGNLVYVANSGVGDANYTGFRLGFNGRLFPIPRSTVTLAANAAPADVLFNGTGTKLAGTEVGTSVIDSFTVGFDGRLTAAPGSPFPAQGLGPFGSEFRPTNPDQLFVSNAHNVGAGTGTISAFSDSFNGTLTPVAGSPFADDQTAPCWVEITHDGQFLFTVNTGSGEISRYAIAPGGALSLLGSTQVGKTGGVGAVDARLSPDGRFLYVDESRIGAVGTFAVNGGNLTELATSPTSLPAGATPAGIAVN
ncbi:MAG TPA: beta-propeller fold lactonase family protein [Streptosporangiaceae bacterium]|nr:beta-propeller fold lactonase family protein [Streptosporangiaceae bacterium]